MLLVQAESNEVCMKLLSVLLVLLTSEIGEKLEEGEQFRSQEADGP